MMVSQKSKTKQPIAKIIVTINVDHYYCSCCKGNFFTESNNLCSIRTCCYCGNMNEFDRIDTNLTLEIP